LRRTEALRRLSQEIVMTGDELILPILAADRTKRLAAGAALRALNRAGSIFTMFFAHHSAHDLKSAKQADPAAYAQFFRHMLDQNILLPPAQWEARFISAPHTRNDIDELLNAPRKSIMAMRRADLRPAPVRQAADCCCCQR
jgi:glutamate-1-semialdehyde aminotransferase